MIFPNSLKLNFKETKCLSINILNNFKSRVLINEGVYLLYDFKRQVNLFVD